VLMNISFVLLTFADAFTIFKGTDTIGTIVLSRKLLGSSERLALREIACGGLTLLGIVLIAKPPLLFGSVAVAAPVSAGGLAVAMAAGCGSAGFNVFTRALSRKGGPHDGLLPPSMLLSFFMVVVFSYVATIAVVARVSGLAEVGGFEWTRLVAPSDAMDYLLLAVYCAGILSGQLMMAAGYATTRAGIAAFLALTEIAFSWVLGVTALGEETSVLAGVGTLVVFASVAALALHPPRQRPVQALARADAAARTGVAVDGCAAASAAPPATGTGVSTPPPVELEGAPATTSTRST